MKIDSQPEKLYDEFYTIHTELLNKEYKDDNNNQFQFQTIINKQKYEL